MKHPFSQDRKLLFYYWGFWVLIGLASVSLQWIYYDKTLKNALFDAFSTCIIYPSLGLSIWYAIKYNRFEDNRLLRLFVFHLVFASLIVIIWSYLSYIFSKAVDLESLEVFNQELPKRLFAGYILYTGYVIFFLAINYYQNLKEKIKQEADLKALIREAELKVLKSQINPHFLFNSLNSISSLTVSNPEKAQEMVINLSTFMRYSLQHNQTEKVDFSRELENIKLYLSIEKVRFGNKLHTIFDIGESCANKKVPNMILQPLFENAIKYGVYETTNQVEVKTSCTCDDTNLYINIENDYDSTIILRKGEGIGLRNIRQRLAIIYKNPDLLQIQDHKTRFEVRLTIPQNQ